MAARIIMPKLGMEMTEASVTAWSFKEGEAVKKGDVVVQIETEKITYEVESPETGVLRKIFVRDGETKPIGELLGVITAEGEAFDGREFASPKAPPKSAVKETATPSSPRSEPPSSAPARGDRIVASPFARKLAKEKGIDLATVGGSGPRRRITEKDILAALEARHNSRPAKTAIPVTRMRKIIADRLTASWTAPHIYLTMEIDATELVKLREALLPEIERETGRKLAYNDLLIKTLASAIEKFPILTGIFKGDQIEIPDEINIGLAVALEEGLVVPVIRRANECSLAEIVCRRTDLVERAKGKKLGVDELSGGTFSLTNLGMFEVDSFTAILNPPQSGILSVGILKDTPVVRNGTVHIAPILKLVLGADHRVVDGAVAAQFLQEIKRILESPRELLIPS